MIPPLKPLDSYTFTSAAIDAVTEFHHRGNTYKVCHASESAYHPSFWSFCDELETRELWWRPERGQVVVDVGADYGSYTLPALAAGARVIAYSPPFKTLEPFEADSLRMSVATNGYTSRSCEVISYALFDASGCLGLGDYSRLPVWSREPPRSGQWTRASTLDYDRITDVDWLKIDTEGCELAILQGGRKTIARDRPSILLEHHYHIDPDCELKCDEFLSQFGYRKRGTRPHHTVAHSLYEAR